MSSENPASTENTSIAKPNNALTSEPSVSTIPPGITIPPPDICKSIEKAVGYVARRGASLEDCIRQTIALKTKLSFFLDDNPYRAYYFWSLEEYKQGRGTFIADKLEGMTAASHVHDVLDLRDTLIHRIGDLSLRIAEEAKEKARLARRLQNLVENVSNASEEMFLLIDSLLKTAGAGAPMDAEALINAKTLEGLMEVMKKTKQKGKTGK